MKKFDFSWALWFRVLLLAGACIAIYNIITNMQPITDGIGDFLGILFPLFLGGGIAYFLNVPSMKIQSMLERRNNAFVKKRAKGLSVLAIYLITIAIFAILISFVIPMIYQNVSDFIEAIPGLWNNFYSWAIGIDLGEFSEFVDLEEQINAFFTEFSAQDVMSYVTSSLGSIGGFLFGLAGSVIQVFVGIIISIYTLLYKKAILAFAGRIVKVIVKEKSIGHVKRYVKEANRIFYKFISTQFLDSCILAVLATILLSIIGVQYAVTLGIFLGICNMIPYFGSIFASIVTMVITFFTGGPTQALITIIALLVLQQIDGNVIGPKLQAGALKVNPILIILSISVGGAYMGLIGMFLGVPVAALLKIIFIEMLEVEEGKKQSKVKAEATGNGQSPPVLPKE